MNPTDSSAQPCSVRLTTVLNSLCSLLSNDSTGFESWRGVRRSNFESRRFWKVNHQEVTQEEPMHLHHFHHFACEWHIKLYMNLELTRSFESEAMTFFWKTEKQPLVQEEAPPVCPIVFWIVQFAIVSGWRTNMLDVDAGFIQPVWQCLCGGQQAALTNGNQVCYLP